jgi:antitoxin CptB
MRAGAPFIVRHRGTGNGSILPLRGTVGRRYAPDQLDLFERMLSLPDPDLQDMVLHPEFAPAGEFGELITALRVFHGLESAP